MTCARCLFFPVDQVLSTKYNHALLFRIILLVGIVLGAVGADLRIVVPVALLLMGVGKYAQRPLTLFRDADGVPHAEPGTVDDAQCFHAPIIEISGFLFPTVRVSERRHTGTGSPDITRAIGIRARLLARGRVRITTAFTHKERLTVTVPGRDALTTVERLEAHLAPQSSVLECLVANAQVRAQYCEERVTSRRSAVQAQERLSHLQEAHDSALSRIETLAEELNTLRNDERNAREQRDWLGLVVTRLVKFIARSASVHAPECFRKFRHKGTIRKELEVMLDSLPYDEGGRLTREWQELVDRHDDKLLAAPSSRPDCGESMTRRPGADDRDAGARAEINRYLLRR